MTPSRGHETFWAEQVITEGKFFCSWDNEVSPAHYIAGGTLFQLFVTKTISQDSNCPVEVAAPSGPEGRRALHPPHLRVSQPTDWWEATPITQAGG